MSVVALCLVFSSIKKVKVLRTTLTLLMFASLPFAASAQSESAPTVADIHVLLRANGTEDVAAQTGPLAAQQLILALHQKIPNLPARAGGLARRQMMA